MKPFSKKFVFDSFIFGEMWNDHRSWVNDLVTALTRTHGRTNVIFELKSSILNNSNLVSREILFVITNFFLLRLNLSEEGNNRHKFTLSS